MLFPQSKCRLYFTLFNGTMLHTLSKILSSFATLFLVPLLTFILDVVNVILYFSLKTTKRVSFPLSSEDTAFTYKCRLHFPLHTEDTHS